MRTDLDVLASLRKAVRSGDVAVANGEIQTTVIELLLDIREYLAQIQTNTETAAILAERTFPEALRPQRKGEPE